MPLAGEPVATSQVAAGSVTAPAALANIASIAGASLPAGIYIISVQVWFGSVVGVENDMKIKGPQSLAITVPVNPVANGQPTTVDFALLTDGATAVNVQAIAGSATGVYKAVIVATKIRGL